MNARSLTAVATVLILVAFGAAQTQRKTTGQANPHTAQEIFAHAAPSIFVVEALDVRGTAIALGSGVSVKVASEKTSGTSGGDPFAGYDVIASGATPSASAKPTTHEPAKGSRSELVLSDQVVTNNHVVEGSASVRVKQGEKVWPARVVRNDSEHDLCLIQVDGLRAPSVVLRKSSQLVIGDKVYALGAPKGLELTISEGLVSGLRDYKGGRLVQTTAAISHGSSGGGLFDSSGRLIGITSFSLSEGQTLNFALPTEWLMALASEAPTQQANAEIAKAAEEEYRLGKSANDNDLYEVAIKHLREAVRLQPDMKQAWSSLGLAYYAVGRYEDAIACQKETIGLETKRSEKEKKENPEFARKYGMVSLSMEWDALGNYYRAAGRHQDAALAHQEAVGVWPEAARLWLDLALDYIDTKRYEDAIRALKETIRLQPDSATGLGPSSPSSLLAQVYDLLDQKQEAEEIRRKQKEAAREAEDRTLRYAKGFASIVRSAIKGLSRNSEFSPFGKRILMQFESGLDAAGLSGIGDGAEQEEAPPVGVPTAELADGVRMGVKTFSGFPQFAPYAERILAELDKGLSAIQSQNNLPK